MSPTIVDDICTHFGNHNLTKQALKCLWFQWQAVGMFALCAVYLPGLSTCLFVSNTSANIEVCVYLPRLQPQLLGSVWRQNNSQSSWVLPQFAIFANMCRRKASQLTWMTSAEVDYIAHHISRGLVHCTWRHWRGFSEAVFTGRFQGKCFFYLKRNHGKFASLALWNSRCSHESSPSDRGLIQYAQKWFYLFYLNYNFIISILYANMVIILLQNTLVTFRKFSQHVGCHEIRFMYSVLTVLQGECYLYN